MRSIAFALAGFIAVGCFHSGFPGDPTTDPDNFCANKFGQAYVQYIPCGDGTCCPGGDTCGDGTNECHAGECCGDPYIPPENYWDAVSLRKK